MTAEEVEELDEQDQDDDHLKEKARLWLSCSHLQS
jgi:hypothetical protein